MHKELKNPFLKTRLIPFMASIVKTENGTIDVGNYELTSAVNTGTDGSLISPVQQFNRGSVFVGSSYGSSQKGYQPYLASTSASKSSFDVVLRTDETAATTASGAITGVVIGNDSDLTDYVKKGWSIVKTPRSACRVILGQINTSTTTINIGSAFTITKNATGDVTVTFKREFFTDDVIAVGTSVTTNKYVNIHSTSRSSLRIQLCNASNALADGILNFIVFGYDGSANQNLRKPISVPLIKPRLIYGAVDSDKTTILYGSGGFTAASGGTGKTVITLTDSFAAEPIVVATPVAGRTSILSSSTSASGFTIATHNYAQSLTDKAAHFLAIGSDASGSTEFYIAT